MNIALIILLILLVNTILGCITTYHTFKRITLADLISSSISGMFIFLFEAITDVSDVIERKCSKIVLFKVDK